MNIESAISVVEFVEKRNSPKFILPVLNLLFLIMLTHYFYSWSVGGYSLTDVKTIDQVLRYFTTGYFLIPILIFLLTWAVTEFLGMIVVNTTVGVIVKRTNRMKASMLKEDSFMQTSWLKDLIARLSRDRVSRKAIWNQSVEQIENMCAAQQKLIMDTLQISVRGISCIVIAYCSIPQFSSVLFVLSLIFCLVGMFVLCGFFFFLEMSPFIIEQYQKAAKKIKAEEKTN